MSEPLNDAALDQLFREARSYNGYLDTPVTQKQLEQIWDVMKFGQEKKNKIISKKIQSFKILKSQAKNNTTVGIWHRWNDLSILIILPYFT